MAGRQKLSTGRKWGEELLKTYDLQPYETTPSNSVLPVLNPNFIQADAQPRQVTVSGILQGAIDEQIISPVAGSNTEIQYNASGVLGASADLTWDDTGKELSVGGDVETTGVIKTGSGTAAAPSVAVGTADNGLYSPGTDQVAISTNGTGRLFVDASGNIGVGTGSPSERLDVNGKALLGRIKIGSNVVTTTTDLELTANSVIRGEDSIRNVINTGGFFGWNIGGTDTSAGTDGSSEVARIDSSGRLGLGTSSPNSRLEVSDSSAGMIRTNRTTDERNHIALGTQDTIRGYIGATSSNCFEISDDVGASKVTVTNGGNVGIGTTSPQGIFETSSSSASNVYLTSTGGNSNLRIVAQDGGSSQIIFGDTADQFTGGITFDHSDESLQFLGHNYAERARIDSSGRLLVGTSSAFGANYLQIQGDQSIGPTGIGAISLRRGDALGNMGANSTLGRLEFGFVDGGVGAQIAAICDAASAGTNDYPGRLVFSTTADGASSPTERMMIDSSGSVLIGVNTKAIAQTTNPYLFFQAQATSTASGLAIESYGNNTATRYHFGFTNPNGVVGSISTNGSATAYNTSSDYRLKENITAVTDGITRLQQLKPSRFNFIADPDKTVDGFLAHEVQDIVPEAITGEKDAVDDEGNPVYQGIDQSKLVPLLTAALQEAVAKIESLEARLTAAGI
jgi:hypothetical protein